MVTQNAIIAALTSTALISLAPNVLLLLFPQYSSGDGEHSWLLSLGQAMAAGGLLGDVFLHTIPHAAGGEEVGLWILLGFTIFLTVDMLMRSLGKEHSHDHEVADSHPSHQKELNASAILLNIVADCLHNFTDGLAIGASFSVSDDRSVVSLLKSRGGLATVSIMFHEIPHELGDFAVLVKNGFSKKQAILVQFGTAVAAMAGTGAGLVLEEFAGETLIFITAGGFIYLAACTIIPEILSEKRASFHFRLMQLVFFGAGIAFLYAVSLLESMGGEHGGHSHSHGHGHPSKDTGHGHQHHVEHHGFHEPEHHHHDHVQHEHLEHGHHEHGEL